MKRTLIVALQLPLLACSRPPAGGEKAAEPPAAREETGDRRPGHGVATVGDDVTELARVENREEPPLPPRRGEVSGTEIRPVVTRTKNGFLANLQAYSTVPTPAYYRGKLYAGGFGTHELHAIDARTGRASWSIHLSDDGPTAPACEDGACVFNTYSCTLFSVDADTGRELWSWYLGSPQLATPVVAGGTVYTSYPGYRQDGRDARYVVAAFELKTGKPKWRRWIDAEVNSTPVAHKGRVYLATHVGTLYEFGADDGAIVDVRAEAIASPPVITSDGVFFGHDELPRENDMIASAGAIFPELELVNAQRRAITPRPRPLVVRHRLVTVEGGTVVASSRKDGRRLWQRRIDEAGEAKGPAFDPLLYAGGSVLFASGDTIYRLDADSGDVVARFPLGKVQVASQPIAHDGWLYAGTTRGAIVAVDTGDGQLTGWDMLGGGPDRRGTSDPEET